MKICPNCQTTFNDANNFCLRDGTPLVPAPGVVDSDDSPTVIGGSGTGANDFGSGARGEPIRIELNQPATIPPPPTATVAPANAVTYQTVPVAPVQQAPRQNTTIIVLLTFLGTLLLLGVVGVGILLWRQNDQRAAGGNAPANAQVNAAPINTAANNNAATNARTNTNSANAAPSATPLPTLRPEQVKEVTGDVRKVLDGWKDSTEDRDIDEHTGYYADSIDYYNTKGASSARVRSDREKAFDSYNTDISIELSNIKITPDPSGERATVVLDKAWAFSGDEKYSTGKVQQQLTLAKVNGRWRITGEKDLKIYSKDTGSTVDDEQGAY